MNFLRKNSFFRQLFMMLMIVDLSWFILIIFICLCHFNRMISNYKLSLRKPIKIYSYGSSFNERKSRLCKKNAFKLDTISSNTSKNCTKL